MGSKRTSPQVLQYLTDRMGQIVHRDDMTRDLKLTDEQVKSAVYNLRQKSDDLNHSIQVVTTGSSWRYRPNFDDGKSAPAKPAKPTVRMFEEVADMGDQGLILKCEDGTLFLAKQMHT